MDLLLYSAHLMQDSGDSGASLRWCMPVCMQVRVLVVCAGYQKLDSLQELDTDDLDTHWQVMHIEQPKGHDTLHLQAASSS
jgi:hypothetical protein